MAPGLALASTPVGPSPGLWQCKCPRNRHSRDLLSPPALPGGEATWLLTQPPAVEGPGPRAAATFMSAVSTEAGPLLLSELQPWPLSPRPQVQAEATNGESGLKPLSLKTPGDVSSEPLPAPGPCGPSSLESREGFEFTAPGGWLRKQVAIRRMHLGASFRHRPVLTADRCPEPAQTRSYFHQCVSV